MAASKASHAIIVAGSIHHQYLVYPDQISRNSAGYQSARAIDRQNDIDGIPPSRMVIRAGGARLVAQLLESASPRWGFQLLGPNLQAASPTPDGLAHSASCIVELSLVPPVSDRPRINLTATASTIPRSSLRVVRKRPIVRSPAWHGPAAGPIEPKRDILAVIYGCNEPGTYIEPALDYLEQLKPHAIVHHMTRPLATGRLWDLLRKGPQTSDTTQAIENFAIIINADDLRAEGISMSKGLSWEATAEDFIRNLGSNGRLVTLVTCPNLIIRFGNEGVIHHRGRDVNQSKLYYHTTEVERDDRVRGTNHMVGLTAAFSAGFALGVSGTFPLNKDQGIRFGLHAAQQMDRNGFMMVDGADAPDYPIAEIINSMQKADHYSVITIPSDKIGLGEDWNIFDAVTGDLSELARKIVTDGPETALSRCPTQQFGEMLSVQRREQESLRAVSNIIEERIKLGSVDEEVTSIGIMGPRGSGKKFAAKNLARHIAQHGRLSYLTYNAQLLRLDDLPTVWRAIRDSTAAGGLTAVAFENFDGVLQSNKPVLNEFLMIVKEGHFMDGGRRCDLGRPLFFFIINDNVSGFTLLQRRPTVSGFDMEDEEDERKVDKSPLLSSLHGVVHLLGPNESDPDDKMFRVRRAIMLRHILINKYPHLAVNGIIQADELVLHALLFVPTYEHGLRSLGKILSISRLSDRTKFDVSALPPADQLSLHVDADKFMSKLRSPILPDTLRLNLAMGLFETYKIQRRAMARTDAEKADLLKDTSMVSWRELASSLQESSRNQADDIPRKLRAVNCFMLEEDRGPPLVRVTAFTTEELDLLSEMEHERFNAERLTMRYKHGPRSTEKRTTPFIVPWTDLSKDWQDVDRVMVECVPDVLAQAGWKIYRVPELNGGE